jgi:hypothetical protein
MIAYFDKTIPEKVEKILNPKSLSSIIFLRKIRKAINHLDTKSLKWLSFWHKIHYLGDDVWYYSVDSYWNLIFKEEDEIRYVVDMIDVREGY